MRPTHAGISHRSWRLALCTASVLLSAAVMAAADRSQLSEAQRTYQRERAACLSGQAGDDRTTCLREAGAALQEARRGHLGEGEGDYERNRLRRCDVQPPADREYCIRRMKGEGVTSGSVEGGGILRELVVPVPATKSN